VSFIFCNIYPEMSAAVVVLRTPYFGTTSPDGSFQVSHVPPERCKFELWSASASETELASQTRDLEVAPGDNPPISIAIHTSGVPKEHLNKYREAYLSAKTDKHQTGRLFRCAGPRCYR
jgi:hypothetical protein